MSLLYIFPCILVAPAHPKLQERGFCPQLLGETRWRPTHAPGMVRVGVLRVCNTVTGRYGAIIPRPRDGEGWGDEGLPALPEAGTEPSLHAPGMVRVGVLRVCQLCDRQVWSHRSTPRGW